MPINYTHYSPFIGGNASEYIVAKGKINITSHGMGSGIYCLSDSYIKDNPSKGYSSKPNVFTIYNPFIISNIDDGDLYINASKTLMEDLETINSLSKPITQNDIINISKTFIDNIIGDKYLPNKRKRINNPSCDKHYNVYDVYKTIFKLHIVKDSLFKFLTDYNLRDDYIEMPINYILKALGFDGVCSTPGLPTHSWSKGNVKFIPYPTNKKHNITPVRYILCRSGIKKPIIDLKCHIK